MAMYCEQIQDFIDPESHNLVSLEGEMKAYFDDKGDTKNYKFKADLAWSAEVSADWVEVDPISAPAGENLDDITPSIPNNEIWHTSANGWSEYAKAIVGYDF